ncbi:hypothetical protein [Ohtaekwangia koreensis]|uniref:Uncharacterized protein n=1 Tax=Ohtaekwangia koreensis TaxID=688867 RepID=A0A1T5MBM6_9BACT|nr:hypothetical protein [Ohtaekwangia koreensis]SKC85602.1 hypothetical protein SAMN05660236_4924 [Ohtaekwangia koreensis]
MNSIRRTIILLLVCSCSHVAAQDSEFILSGSDSLFSYEDSLNVFTLIDSLLQLEDTGGSQLAVRVGYNSNVLSAGRTLGIDNFGLAPGISYYHSTGLYADVTGFWSKDFEPSYYLTVASVGYLHTFSKRFSAMAGYDRYFYSEDNDDNYIPYKNTLSLTPILELHPVTISLNYAYYFGDAQVHRITPGVSIILQKRNWKGISRIAITPAFFALFGNDIITEVRYPETVRELIRRVRQGLPWYEVTERNEFGLMNYTISAPLSVTYKNFNLTFTYNYNIPKALPGETLTYSESSFLSGSLSYFIGLRRSKTGL